MKVADSNITKRALSEALKSLMEDTPFEKISVSDICDQCSMNRKSFYYHFRDKYDLVNWIFDTEFITLANTRSSDDRWEFIERCFHYFYENRNFYRKVLKVKGQNSFPEHFREFMQPLLRNRIEEIMGHQEIPQMCIDFFADGIVCAMERWLLDKDCMTPEEFVSNIKYLIQSMAVYLYNDMGSIDQP